MPDSKDGGGERLTLDPKPGGIWRKCREAVRTLLAAAGNGPNSYTIGGGTILAARLHHRRSSDIDLLVDGAKAFRGWSRDDTEWLAKRGQSRKKERLAENAFREAMIEAGGTTTVNPRNGLVAVQFTGAHDRLEMLPTTPLLRGKERSAVTNGHVEKVLSNGQILAGKMQRALKPPVRDMFDLVVAGIGDPEAAEQAVNNWGIGRIEGLAEIWSGQNEWLEKKAQEARGIDREGIEAFLEVRTGRLGTQAGETAIRSLYREAEVLTRDGAVVLHTVTFGGTERERTAAAEDAVLLMEGSGLRGCCCQIEQGEMPRAKDLGRMAERAAASGANMTVGVVRDGMLEEWHEAPAKRPPRGKEVPGYKRPDRGGDVPPPGGGGGRGRGGRGGRRG